MTAPDHLRPGERVEFVCTADPYTHLRPGDRGTLHATDGIGTVHVSWDSGSTLGVLLDAGDVIRLVSDDGCYRCGRGADDLGLCAPCAGEELARGLEDLVDLIRRAQAS